MMEEVWRSCQGRAGRGRGGGGIYLDMFVKEGRKEGGGGEARVFLYFKC